MSIPSNEHGTREPGHDLETDSQIEALEVLFGSSEYTQSIEAFDAVQKELLDTLAVLFTEPNDHDQLDAMLFVAAELVRKFSTCVERINTDTESKDRNQRVAAVLQLLIGEDNIRQEFFALLAPCDEYANRAYNRDDIQGMIESSYEEFPTFEEVRNQLTETFAFGLTEDIKHVLSHLPETSEVQDEASQPVMRKIGKHALDVAKIAGGVGIGVASGIILASRYFSKRTSKG